MEPNRFGRVLGVGARVAAEKLKERAAQGARPANAEPARLAGQGPVRIANQGQARPVEMAAEGGRRLARGAGRFGASLWRPFAHATGVLTLEITGVFFVLFTIFFAAHSWQIYKAGGWHDRHLVVYGGFGVLFAWFAVSSFWRARRKQRGL